MNYDPVIIIPGIGQSKLILADEKGNKIKNVWPIELDSKAIADELKSSLMKMMLFRKDAGFSDKIAAIVGDICEPLSLNDDGTKKHNVIPVAYNRSVAECSEDEKKFIYKMIPMESLGEKTGEDKLFFFAYDPFGDAYDIAEKLNDFVSFVKNDTGSEKVNLICVSLGGVVLRAYLDLYSEKNDIGKVVNVVSALDGSSLIADIFEDKLSLDDPAELLNAVGGKAASMSSMLGMLPKEVVNNTISKSLSVLKKNLILSCTMMWGSIPSKRFSAILDKYSGIDNTLKAKIMRFNCFTQSFSVKAKEMSANGTQFFQICGSGKGIVPVCESENVQSDGIVDVSSASFGAVCTSVDSQPDVAGCVFPEKTWFFKGMMHNDAAYNDVVLSLVSDILTDNGDLDEYPQFNGTRNIKKLKYNLIPKLKKAVEDGKGSDEAAKAVADYEKILSNKVIDNDDDVKELENRILAFLENSN